MFPQTMRDLNWTNEDATMTRNDPETLDAARQGAGLPPAGPLPPVSLQELLGRKVYLADGREVGEVQDYGHTSEEVVVRLRGAK